VDVGVEQVHHPLALEGQPRRQQLVPDDGERVKVALGVERLAHRLLGGDVGGGAGDHAARRERLLAEHLGEAEVGQDRLQLRVEEDVRRLHVAVQHALLVGVVEGLAERPEEGKGLAGGQRRLRHPVIERPVRHVLDDHVGLPRVLAEVEDGQDMAVAQAGNRARLALEPIPRVSRRTDRREELDRRPPLEAGMEGAIDDAHPAAAQVGVDDVAADLGTARDFAFHGAVATGLYGSTPGSAQTIARPAHDGGPTMSYLTDPRVDDYINPLPEWQQAICRQVRDLVHVADPEVSETIKRTRQPYFVLQGNICALLAAKDHVNVFLYDGGIVPDPQGIITGGHGNSTGRTVAVGNRESINEAALTAMFKQIIANNRAGGWRKLKAQG